MGAGGRWDLDGYANMRSMGYRDRRNFDPIARPRVQAALSSGDLGFLRRHAKEIGGFNLADALRICVLIHEQDRERYESAAVRWLGRFALEAPLTTLDDLAAAIDAFDALPHDPDGAVRRLLTMCAQLGGRESS